MKKQLTLEQKLADWESAFDSMSPMQNNEALEGLIEGLRSKIGVITPGVA